MTLERIKTGIPHMDDMLGGGFEKNSTTLIVGDAGSGKTILALQVLYNGATMFNENAVFISFEEPRESLFRHMAEFGWDLKKLEDEGKFKLLYFHPHEVHKFIEEGGGTLIDEIRSINAQRVVIDSLTAYTLLAQTKYEARESLIALFDVMHKWNVTTFTTQEATVSLKKERTIEAEYLADAVVILYNIKNVASRAGRAEAARVHALEVFKLRGGKHSERIVPLKIEPSKGIVLFPGEWLFLSE